ncbi:MAG TPA: hypothetical protein VGL48_05520 [Acidimicrobiales bacterium]|jgi:hypothetical protein
MSKTTIRVGAVAVTSVAVLVGLATSAGAAAPVSLSSVQAKAATAITLRVNDLNAAMARVSAAKNLGSGAATLTAYLQNGIAPLQALGQKIAADTTVSAAQADASTIFTNFRVLALVLPAARLAADGDGIINGSVPTLTADSAKAAARVSSSNEGTLDPLITDLNAQISAATNAASGISPTALGYTPTQWNANHALLSTERLADQTARNDIKQARSDLRQISNFLKTDHAAATPTTAS